MEKTSTSGVAFQVGYETEVTVGAKGNTASTTIPPALQGHGVNRIVLRKLSVYLPKKKEWFQ